jgi:hypothetical protein
MNEFNTTVTYPDLEGRACISLRENRRRVGAEFPLEYRPIESLTLVSEGETFTIDPAAKIIMQLF